jgi:hypothetical protein
LVDVKSDHRFGSSHPSACVTRVQKLMYVAGKMDRSFAMRKPQFVTLSMVQPTLFEIILLKMEIRLPMS